MGGTGQDDRRHKKAYTRVGPLKNEAFCMQNGNTKGPVLLTGSLRYNQFLVIWGGKAPVPTAGRFPDSKLNARCRLPKPDGSVTGAKAP